MSEAPEREAGELTDEALVIDAPAGEGSQDQAPSAEDRALAMGWTPKTQFKGHPEKWVDAETFVKRGEEFLPFLKANNKRLEQALDRANAKMAGLEKAVSSAVKHISKAEQRGYEQRSRELQTELATYAAAGDVENVKSVTKDIVELEREALEEPAAEAPQLPAELQAFIEENPWYGKDKALTAAAQAIGLEVFEEGFTGKAQVAEVTKRLKAEFPTKFEKPDNPARRNPAAVEGGGNAPRRGAKTYADLPADAKKMCDEFCRDIKGFTKEKFVKDYDFG